MASEPTIIAANASGTETIAGWVRIESSGPVRAWAPTITPAVIAPIATAPPATMPSAAPRAVSRGHQMPSTNSGQNVLAARAKAQPTRMLMSTLRTASATTAGTAMPTAATIRNRRRRTVRPTPRAPRPQTS